MSSIKLAKNIQNLQAMKNYSYFTKKKKHQISKEILKQMKS